MRWGHHNDERTGTCPFLTGQHLAAGFRASPASSQCAGHLVWTRHRAGGVHAGRGHRAILPFPLQNQLTRPLRNAAAKQERAEFLSLWAGQGIRLAQRRTATQLVESLTIDTETAIRKLAAVHRGRGK